MMEKKEIQQTTFSPIRWLRAKLDPIRASNLTQICIVADVITKMFVLGRFTTPTGPFFSYTAFVKLNQTKVLRFFSSPPLLLFLVPAFVLWLQVSYIIHEDWETYPVRAILAVIPWKGAIFKSWIGHRWRQGSC